MKILYLTNQMYLHGGIEKILSQKINFLIDEGYDITLCTSEHKSNEFIYKLNEKLKHVDLNVNYEKGKSYFSFINLIKIKSHIFKLKKLIYKEQPDIIVSVNYTPEQYFLPLIKKSIPIVKEFHVSGSTFNINNTFNGFIKRKLFSLFSLYDSIVVLNDDEKKYYPFNNIEVIPNFLKIPEDNININDKQNIIIAAGRIAQVKQFDHLIFAWKEIFEEFPEWQICVYGDGDQVLIQRLENLISTLKLKNIKLMGSVNNLQVIMKNAEVFAMTSATECFPMVLLEAQASGMVIVSYDCPNGPKNIIKNGVTGILTPHNSISEFSKQLSKILKNKEKRNIIKNNAINDVKWFEDSKIMEKWQKLFKNLNN